MSTKIWVAYKTDQVHLWDLVHDIRARGIIEVKKVLREVHIHVASTIDLSNEDYKRVMSNKYLANYPEEERDFRGRLNAAEKIIRKNYKKASASAMRDPFDFDVSVVFRHLEGSIYLIPFCDMQMRRVLDFLKEDERLEDFHYQNQVDEDGPEPANWDERGRVWDTLDENWQDFLVLEICTESGYYLLDVYSELLEERSKNNRKE